MVRDKIPELFPQHRYRKVLGPAERLELLRRKMAEELVELLSAPSGADFLEELADLMEVANSLREMYGWSAADLEAASSKKRAERGGFEDDWVMR